MTARRALAALLVSASLTAGASPRVPAFRREVPAIRGMTVGPIESGCHPGVGYGSNAFGATLDELARSGVNWVSLTPFGRVGTLEGRGVDPTFEAPHAKNREDLGRAIDQAHARGLRVLLVPHLWVESGGWRAQIDPGDDAGWRAWAASYERYVLAWAAVAEKHHADMLAVGVELRSWVTTERVALMRPLIQRIRRTYRGMLTYSANWDDASDTLLWNDVDMIGINGFYPLADGPGASGAAMLERAKGIAREVSALGARYRKPVYFAEMGYTTRPDPAWKPWEWPEDLGHPAVDEVAQATATQALLTPFLAEAGFAGFFVWRVYADPNDVSQEPAFGFSPRGKRAERVLRSLWKRRWAGERHARWPSLAVETDEISSL